MDTRELEATLIELPISQTHINSEVAIETAILWFSQEFAEWVAGHWWPLEIEQSK